MTRRDFDAETKANKGPHLASDERCNYREGRHREHDGSGVHVPTRTRDYLVYRASKMRYLRAGRPPWELPTLGLGSPFRAVARSKKVLLEAHFHNVYHHALHKQT